MIMLRNRFPALLMVAALALAGACHKSPPVARPTPPPPAPFPNAPSTTPPPPASVPEPPPVPVEPTAPISADPLVTRDIDQINKNSPLKPAFFAYDSDELDDTARATLSDDAQILKKYPQWVVTVEGHTDERGSAEYNLALGERRAVAAKNYLVSLGIGADRLRTVSYGKEFPFDPGKDESAYKQNRRAHFMLTAK